MLHRRVNSFIPQGRTTIRVVNEISKYAIRPPVGALTRAPGLLSDTLGAVSTESQRKRLQ